MSEAGEHKPSSNTRRWIARQALGSPLRERSHVHTVLRDDRGRETSVYDSVGGVIRVMEILIVSQRVELHVGTFCRPDSLSTRVERGLQHAADSLQLHIHPVDKGPRLYVELIGAFLSHTVQGAEALHQGGMQVSELFTTAAVVR